MAQQPQRPRLSDRMTGGINTTDSDKARNPDESHTDTNRADPEDMSRQNEEISNAAAKLNADELDVDKDMEAARAEAEAMGDVAEMTEYSDEDARRVLIWALRKLTHPSEQTVFCSGHGKVPVSHMCAYYRNEDYALALKVAGLAAEDEVPEVD